LWVLAVVFVGWISVTSAPAAATCGPPAITVVGAPNTNAGVTVAYPSQMVTIKGSGWSSCAAAQPSGCGSSSGAKPMQGIRIDIAHARGGTSMSRPETWAIGDRVRRLGVFEASDDASFAIASVPMPPDPGRYVIVASLVGDPHRWVIGWAKIL
jgi:hypothetical protein